MYKINKDRTRQIHIKVPEDVHRNLKIMAAIENQTINEMLTTKVIGILVGGMGSKEETNKE